MAESIKNINYQLVTSLDSDFKEVLVTYTVKDRNYHHYVFVKAKRGLTEKAYLEEAKKKFELEIKSGQINRATKMLNGGKFKKPFLITTISIIGVAAVAVAGFFTWKHLTAMDLHSRIKRVEYTEITGEDKAVKVHNVLDAIYLGQTEEKGDGSRRLSLTPEGSIDTTVEFKINGSITHEELRMKDFNLNSKTQYSMSWNREKGYIKYSGDNDNWYILKDSSGQYWNAYSYKVGDKTYKERISTTFQDDAGFVDHISEALMSRGLFLENIDLGLSGLGYNPVDYVADENKMPGIADLFHNTDGTLFKVYDFLNEKVGSGHNLFYKVASNTKDTFSGELGGNLDLGLLDKNLKAEIPEEYREFIDKLLGGHFSFNGALNFDLFAAWNKNYICQQEYMIKANNLYYSRGSDYSFTELRAYADIYFGEEASQTCKVSDAEIAKILEEHPVHI